MAASHRGLAARNAVHGASRLAESTAVAFVELVGDGIYEGGGFAQEEALRLIVQCDESWLLYHPQSIYGLRPRPDVVCAGAGRGLGLDEPEAADLSISIEDHLDGDASLLESTPHVGDVESPLLLAPSTGL